MQKQKLLLVDDDHDFVDCAAEAINGMDVDLYLAYDGEEGLRVFEKERPRIVITDVVMPKMNGIDFANAVHAIDPEVIILAITGHPDQLSKEEQFRELVRLSLLKPLMMEDLLDSVELCLSNLRLANR